MSKINKKRSNAFSYMEKIILKLILNLFKKPLTVRFSQKPISLLDTY